MIAFDLPRANARLSGNAVAIIDNTIGRTAAQAGVGINHSFNPLGDSLRPRISVVWFMRHPAVVEGNNRGKVLQDDIDGLKSPLTKITVKNA
jgi:hypothetical protein